MVTTIVKMVGNMAGIHNGVSCFASDPGSATDNVTIRDLTVDCNWAELAFTADEGLGARSVTDAVITQNSPLISSSSAAFTDVDYASTLTGAGIPVGTKILSIQDAHHATMSANAIVSGNGVSVLIGGEKLAKTGAITLRGSNNLVEYVRAMNGYGSWANLLEHFLIYLAAPQSGDGTNNVIQLCRAEQPQGNYGDPFALAGWFDGPNHLITNSRVIDCIAIGVNSNLLVGFTGGGVNVGNVEDCQVDSNTFVDCLGAAYIDAGSVEGLSVTNNTVTRGWMGVGLRNPTLPKRKIEISGNHFFLQTRDGIAGGIYVSDGLATDLTISNNIFTCDAGGTGEQQFWGIVAAAVNDVLVSNNVMTLPNFTVRKCSHWVRGLSFRTTTSLTACPCRDCSKH